MFETGYIIGNCQIIEEIGAGGTGVIYKAYHQRLQKYVVLKRIKQTVIDKINVRSEVDVLKRVKHTYLPQVIDFIVKDNEVFTVIDFIEGESLEFYIKQNYSFPQQYLIKWAKQLCEALEYLHSLNPPIIHSDIKPANIMVTPEGNICLIDFNISLEDDKKAHLAGMTQEYASPEQYVVANKLTGALSSDGYTDNPSAFTNSSNTEILRINRIDARSDIYSLGATFYCLMTGVKPQKAAIGNIPLNKLEIPYSEAFADIITKAMEQNLNKRYQTANDMLKDLVNITKLDKRYKALRIKQSVANVVFSILLISFVALSYFGFNTIRAEKLQKYNEFITVSKSAEKLNKYDDAVQALNNAKKIFPKKIDAYYEEIKAYSKSSDFDNAINYGKDLINNPLLQSELGKYSKENADINYLIANAYFEKEEYQNALIYYNNAVSLNQSNPLYFRDLAITLARTGDREKAESKLLQAKELGLEEPSALLVSGELLLSKGEYNNAISEFNKVINLTDDNEIIFRAYILSSDAYKKNNDINNQISLLEIARKNLPVEYQNPILILLANAYSLKSQQNSDEYIEFAKKALDVNLVLYQNGYQSESLLINLSNLYQRLTQFDNALKILTEAKDKYPESYKVFLRLAFLETDIQSKIEENKRDYTLVANYYNTAKKYYKTAQNNGVSDPEMKKLETIIAKLKEGKWL